MRNTDTRVSSIRIASILCPFTAAILLLAGAGHANARQNTTLPAIDPQKVQDQQDMTWSDYKPIPGKDWADPSIQPVRKFRMALVAVDFPDFPFVITRPKKSDPFGNPQIDPIPREKVAQFYADFYNKPSKVNHGHTINGYWMEQSRGKFGITELKPFGPFLMPTNFWEYGLSEFGQNNYTPDGTPANHRSMETEIDRVARAADPSYNPRDFDCVLRIYAGYDETGVWQEFGEMKFQDKDHIPPQWGNPNPEKPRWVPTRYVPWTSWLAGAQQWGESSIRQGENSGTITHELGHHAFGIGDNNNNPYVTPYRRVGSGPWDMMDRGSFNGPGGPHSRWEVPAIAGAAMPAGLMLRNKMKNEFVTKDEVLTVNRDGLAKSGLVVANITSRAVDPLPNSLAGVIVRLDGAAPHDRTPADNSAINPLSPGTPNYDFYSLEVVQRIGYDSYCPDSGVLLAKNKDGQGRNGGPNSFTCFNWVIDAHPEDINQVDFMRPDGTPVMRTIADYRQLNDALFHAGVNSGSEYEWEDTPNRLHFYIIDIQKNPQGILSYTVGVKSLDGIGPQTRGLELTGPAATSVSRANTRCEFTLKNTGAAADTDASLHPQNASTYLNGDIYRLEVTVEGKGWTAQLQNALAAVKFGESIKVPVFVTRGSGSATVILTGRSESNPSKVVTAQCKVTR